MSKSNVTIMSPNHCRCRIPQSLASISSVPVFPLVCPCLLRSERQWVQKCRKTLCMTPQPLVGIRLSFQGCFGKCLCWANSLCCFTCVLEYTMCASMHFRSPLPLPFSFLDCSNQAHLRHPPPKPTLVFGTHCTFSKPSHERQHSRVPPVSAITPQGNLPSSIAPSIAIRNTDDPQPNGSR